MFCDSDFLKSRHLSCRLLVFVRHASDENSSHLRSTPLKHSYENIYIYIDIHRARLKAIGVRMSTLRSKVEDWSLRMSTLRGNVEYRLLFACVLSGFVDLTVSRTMCFYSNNEHDLSNTHGFLIGAFQIPCVVR